MLNAPYEGFGLVCAVHVPLHPTGEVFYWISNGVPGTGMPVWKEKLSDTERWTIIRYLDALASKRVDH